MDDRPVEQTRSRAINLEFADRLAQVMDCSQWGLVHAPAGRRLLATGDPVRRLPLIVSGSIEAVIHQMSDEGNPVVPVSWGPGELVMMSQLFSHTPAAADLVAAVACDFRWLPVEAIEQTLLGHQDLLVLVVRFLAQRLREAQERERAWLERGVHERVLVSLARIAWELPSADGRRVMIESTHESLAARCGISRPRLSKELKQLEDAGLVRLGRGHVEIPDRGRFTALLSAPPAT